MPSAYIINITLTNRPTNITLALNTNERVNTTTLLELNENENCARIARAVATKFEKKQIIVQCGDEPQRQSLKEIIQLVREAQVENGNSELCKSELVGR